MRLRGHAITALVVFLHSSFPRVVAQTKIPSEFRSEFYEDSNSSQLCLSPVQVLSPPLSCSLTSFHSTSSVHSQDPTECDMVRHHIYFHAIFDFRRPSSLALTLNQVCRALELCIAAANFRVVLHLERKRLKGALGKPSNRFSRKCGPDYLVVRDFLLASGIPFTVWTGEFDTISSQRARMVALRDLQPQNPQSNHDWILQVDADEMPVFYPTSLSYLMHRLQSRSHADGCDAVYGYLSERVTGDGKLVNITLGESLESKFPLLCNVKEGVEKAENRKLVLYRASFRAGIGNHRLICERKMRPTRPLSATAGEMENCRQIMEKRTDFRLMHPRVASLPRKCDDAHAPEIATLSIEHFKYTWGLQDYLQERIRVFKKKKLAWHSESSAVLSHLSRHSGICVSCPQLKCKNVTSRISSISV